MRQPDRGRDASVHANTSSEAPPEDAAAAVAAATAILANRRFVRYAIAKLLQLLGQNALVYGLFLILIRRDDSSLITGAFVLTSVLPSILLSLPGGVVGDSLPKKAVLLTTLFLRILITWLFLDLDPGVPAILLLTLLMWTVYQFYSPAENAALMALVDTSQIARASALLHAVSLAAQLGGAGLLAPFALKLLDETGLFLIVLALLVASSVTFTFIPNLSPARAVGSTRVSWIAALPQGLRAIRASRDLSRATLIRVLIDTGLVVVVVAAPKLVNDVLRLDAANTVYVAAPAALGIGFGLLAAPLLVRVLSPRLILLGGFVVTVGVIFSLAFVPELGRFLDEQTLLPLRELDDTLGVRREVVAAMLLLPVGGLGVSFVQVAARTVVYERVPSGLVGQVFATQSAIGSVAALAPTLLAGVLLDTLPVDVVLILVASVIGALGLLLSTGLLHLLLRARSTPDAPAR